MTRLRVDIDLDAGVHTTPDSRGALAVARMLATVANEICAWGAAPVNPHEATGPVRDSDGVQVGEYWVESD